MFSEQTEITLARLMPFESGLPGVVVLPAEIYREIVSAARHWDALRSGPVNRGATVALVAQPDGSVRIEPC